jgi:Fur family transcriptional regulator, ferric uptake regulator
MGVTVLDKVPRSGHSSYMRLSVNKQGEVQQATSRFAAVLRAHGQRWTGERESIMALVCQRTGPFTADEIADDLNGRGLAVSRSTVYRTLPLLVEAGLVSPRVASGEEHHFEYTFGSSHHDHLVCQRCGKIVEFQFEAFEMLQEAVAAKYGFELVGHVHELFGLCEACRGQKSS